MSAFGKLSTLTDFKDEVYANLESNTSWGRNQLKEMIDEVFKRYHERLKQEIKDEQAIAQSNW
jgi:iron-sulfur cluster repair protein YtfE (RIC family)